MENPAESYGTGIVPEPNWKRTNKRLPPLIPFSKTELGKTFMLEPPSLRKIGAAALVPLCITNVSVGNIFNLSTHNTILSAHGSNKNPGQPVT
jgi:hypothetical protein